MPAVRLLLQLLILLSFASNALGQRGPEIRLSAAKAQQAIDSLRVLPIVRQEANAWRLAAESRGRAIDSLLYAGQMLRDAQDSTKAAYNHQLVLDRDKDVQIAVLRAKATRRTFTTILSVLGNIALGFVLLKH